MERFDAGKAHQLIKDTISLIRSQCPAGATEWLEANRPDLVKGLNGIGDAVNDAFDQENTVALPEVLNEWSQRHAQAFGIFNSRPPVINRQEPLYEADNRRANGSNHG